MTISNANNHMNLDKLISEAVDDPSREPELFARLLEATLYVHAPKVPTGPDPSLLRFKTPQGVLAIPVFTDRKKAEFAGRGNVRIVPIQGRTLLSATPGATVMINPNDDWCILYPEEILTLLQGECLGRTPERIEMPKGLELQPAVDPAPALVGLITESLESVEPVLDAWLTQAVDEAEEPTGGYVVVIAAEAPHHERIARSLTLALAAVGKTLEKTVDIAFIEPGEVQKEWLNGNADCLIYRRAWLPGLKSRLHGNS